MSDPHVRMHFRKKRCKSIQCVFVIGLLLYFISHYIVNPVSCRIWSSDTIFLSGGQNGRGPRPFAAKRARRSTAPPPHPPRENLEGEDAPSFAYPSFMALDVYSSEKPRVSFKPIISENESFLSTPLTQRAATGIRAGLDFALTVPGVAVRGPLSPQGSRHGQAGSTSIQSSY